MIARTVRVNRAGARPGRPGVVAVEFAVCLPLLFLILFGLWEVGRMVEVQNVMVNAAREGARDASMGQNNLNAVVTNIALYLQSGEPTAFNSGDSYTLKSPVITLPANSYGYTCWDSTANVELFTVAFTDVTNSSVTDPTGMSQLDQYTITISTPYKTIGWLPVATITGMTRISVSTNWACMVDSPFTIAPYLQAE